MGATSTQASLVEYGSFQKKLSKFSAKNKTVGEFSVIGKAWDETTGTLAFDRVITEYLADHWNKVHMEPKGKGDVRTNTRAMAKLRFKASKVKEVLSANKAIPISMGSFMDDADLKAHITREQFEDRADELFHRAVKVRVLTHAIEITLHCVALPVAGLTAAIISPSVCSFFLVLILPSLLALCSFFLSFFLSCRALPAEKGCDQGGGSRGSHA